MNLFSKKVIIIFAFTVIFTTGTMVYADTANVPVTVTISSPTLDLTTTPPTGIDFGGIINGSVSGGNSVIVLNSSTNVASTPTRLSGDAALDGTGNSGTITVESNIDATLDVSCVSVTGSSGTGTSSGVSVLDEFGGAEIALLPTTVQTYTPSTLTVTAGTPTTLHVGALITVANDTTAATYSGTIVMDISYP